MPEHEKPKPEKTPPAKPVAETPVEGKCDECGFGLLDGKCTNSDCVMSEEFGKAT